MADTPVRGSDVRQPPVPGERRDRAGWPPAAVEAEAAAAQRLLAPSGGDPAFVVPAGWRHDTADPVWAFPVPFTVLDGLGLLLWGVVAQVVVGTAAFLVVGGDISDTGALVAVAVIYLVTLLGVRGLLGLRGTWSWRLAGPVRPRAAHVGIGVGSGIGAWVVLNLLVVGFSALTGYEPETTQSVLEQTRSGGTVGIVLGVVVAVVLAPLVEEVVHRGVLFQAFRRLVGARWGAVVSAAVFALVHLELLGEPPLLVSLFGFGIVLAWVLHRTGSLLAAVTAHMAFNAVTLVLSLAFPVV